MLSRVLVPCLVEESVYLSQTSESMEEDRKFKLVITVSWAGPGRLRDEDVDMDIL